MPSKKVVARKIAHGQSIDKRLRFRFTDTQQEIIKAIMSSETNVVFIDGPAGSSKTLLATYCGVKELFSETKGSFLYVRTAAESGKINIGARPGEVSDKIHHLVGPLLDKLHEMLPEREIGKLLAEEGGRIEALPVNDIRGSSWRDKFVVVDESQNFEFSELVTAITRLGSGCKIVLIGDSMQSDIRKSGWVEFINMFTDEPSRKNGVHTFTLTEEDIVRSEFVKFVVGKVNKRNQDKKEDEAEWRPSGR